MAGANEVGFGIERIFQVVEPFADRGMNGTIRLEVSLLPSAADFVRIAAIYNHHTRSEWINSKVSTRSQEEREGRAEKSERVNLLRAMICEQAGKLRIICPVVSLEFTFHDGKCVSLTVSERTELNIGAR